MPPSSGRQNTPQSAARNGRRVGQDADPISLLERMAAHHSETLDMCTELEGIADSLPFDLDEEQCREMAGFMLPCLKRSHTFEEGEFLPFAQKTLGMGQDRYDAIRASSKSDHCEDEGYAEEISDMLVQCADDTKNCNAEAMGYMLRGFFEGLRRHIRFEQVVLVDPIRSRLSRS